MKKKAGILWSLLFAVFNFRAMAAEHPEHPTTHEHPAGSMEKSKQADQEKNFQNDFEKVVKDYIDSEAKKTNGVYTLRDDAANKDRKLKLLKVHKNKICMLDQGKTCFACADFRDLGSKDKLDLDFYYKKAEDGSLTIDKVLIHKLNGKPRFTYDKENKMVPLK